MTTDAQSKREIAKVARQIMWCGFEATAEKILRDFLARAVVPSLPAATMDEDIEDANFEAAVTSFENNYKDRKDYQWDHDSYVAGFEDGMAHRGARAALTASVPAADLERKNELLIQTIESLRAASVPQAAPEAKLGFREWLCQGGAGHEDGEDGIRACTLPLNSAIEMVDDYLEYLREPERRKAIDGEGK